jgi:NADPH-dependent FMN reductase
VLHQALKAAAELGAETQLISLNDLEFRACEGYYSKSAHACTWPCSITQMDKNDQLDRVYEALVHWADAIIVASPIRWGAASSLYFKMAERLNCIQNAITLHIEFLFVTRLQDSLSWEERTILRQSLGKCSGSSPSWGSSFRNFRILPFARLVERRMERNVEIVRNSKELAEGAAMLVKRCLELAQNLIARDESPTSIERGGRKAHPLLS